MPTSSKTDLIVAGAAIFISLCTLVVLLYEARILREQQRAAVWPYVEIGLGFRQDGFHLYTDNQGVGPARIRSMQVLVDGEPVKTWEEMLRALGVADSVQWSDQTNGRVIPGQSSIHSLDAEGEARTDTVAVAYLRDGRLAIEVCYCSVYDECWRVTARGRDKERETVESCEATPESEFLD